jgi:hypothetical protein
VAARVFRARGKAVVDPCCGSARNIRRRRHEIPF